MLLQDTNKQQRETELTKPWLTKGLLISIRRKQWLYKTQFLNGNSLGKDQFKMYSNMLNKLKQLSKKMYYHNEVETNKNNPKRMWNVLRTLLPNGKKQVTHEIPKLIYKGTQIDPLHTKPLDLRIFCKREKIGDGNSYFPFHNA